MSIHQDQIATALTTVGYDESDAREFVTRACNRVGGDTDRVFLPALDATVIITIVKNLDGTITLDMTTVAPVRPAWIYEPEKP